MAAFAWPATAHELETRALRCMPALPYYCANIHIGCAGRSRLATQVFDVTFNRGGPRVRLDDGSDWAASLSGADGNMILRREGSNDWIRIEKDGRFSQRIYPKGQALMTRGKCVSSDPA